MSSSRRIRKGHATLSRMFNQPAEKTWETYKDFNKVPIPGATVTMEGENNVVGSVRTIRHSSGLEVIERLDAYVNSGPHYLFTYSFTKPMLGVEAYTGTWIIYPAGTDGKRSKMDMFLSWESTNDEANDVFESIIVNLLQNAYLCAPDPKEK